jgi:hypothetical protein
VFGIDGTLAEDQHADQLASAMSHLDLKVRLCDRVYTISQTALQSGCL